MTYRIVVRSAAAGGGREHVFDLARDVALVGRRSGVDVPLPHPEVGGVHARLERQPAGVVLVDAGARGGTRVNGEPLPAGGRRALTDGDVVEIAGVFRLSYAARSPAGVPPTSAGETAALAREMVRDVLAALGRASPEAAPTLEIVAGPAVGRVLELPAPGRDVVLGRGEACDATIEDPDLSREHARLHRDWAGVTIADLGSKNGTWLGGERLAPGVERRLADGDRVVLGATTLVYRDPTDAYLRELSQPSPEAAGAAEPMAASEPAPPAHAAASDASAPIERPAAAEVAAGRAWLTWVVAGLIMAAAAAALVWLLRA